MVLLMNGLIGGYVRSIRPLGSTCRNSLSHFQMHKVPQAFTLTTCINSSRVSLGMSPKAPTPEHPPAGDLNWNCKSLTCSQIFFHNHCTWMCVGQPNFASKTVCTRQKCATDMEASFSIRMVLGTDSVSRGEPGFAFKAQQTLPWAVSLIRQIKAICPLDALTLKSYLLWLPPRWNFLMSFLWKEHRWKGHQNVSLIKRRSNCISKCNGLWVLWH